VRASALFSCIEILRLGLGLGLVVFSALMGTACKGHHSNPRSQSPGPLIRHRFDLLMLDLAGVRASPLFSRVEIFRLGLGLGFVVVFSALLAQCPTRALAEVAPLHNHSPSTRNTLRYHGLVLDSASRYEQIFPRVLKISSQGLGLGFVVVFTALLAQCPTRALGEVVPLHNHSP
jgi:hypothetical protein